jgi:hypothetical protein
MRLNITGKSSNVENKIIRDAAKFYLNEILRPTTFKKIEISIFLEEFLLIWIVLFSWRPQKPKRIGRN